MSLASAHDALHWRQVVDALTIVDPKIIFKVFPNPWDKDGYDVLYGCDEMSAKLYEELHNFHFIVFYSGKHPDGMQFSVKKVYPPRGSA